MIDLRTPLPHEIPAILTDLAAWQIEGVPVQLHPGDLGWAARSGPEPIAAALRVWTRNGRAVAIGLLDGAALVRLAIAPDLGADQALADRIAADLDDPSAGVLPSGAASVETPSGSLVGRSVEAHGWTTGERWTPLRRDLAEAVEEAGVQVARVGVDQAALHVAVHRTAFPGSTFTEECWRAMAAAPGFRDAACLVALDRTGAAAAAIIVWSAGLGRPGLVEPMGVDPAHRGRGFGRAITLAGAAALRATGASSALVVTPSANVGAVATYRSAGFVPGPERRDLERA